MSEHSVTMVGNCAWRCDTCGRSGQHSSLDSAEQVAWIHARGLDAPAPAVSWQPEADR